MDQRRRALVVAVLGGLLVCSPLVLLADEPRYRYAYAARETTDVPDGLLDCTREAERACALERRVHAAGDRLRVPVEGAAFARDAEYDSVRLADGSYRPETRLVQPLNGSDALVLSLEPVPPERALSRAGTNRSALPPAARRAVERGDGTEVAVGVRAFSAAPPSGDEFGVVVHDGRRYEVSLDRDPVRDPLERLGLGFLPELAALVAVPGGVWLLLLGRGDYARAADGTATDPSARDRGRDGGDGPRDAPAPTSAGAGRNRVRSHAATAVVALGVLALVAGVAVPADVAPAYRYEAEPVGDAAVAAGSPAVLDCAADFRPRACALERLVRRSDGLAVEDERAWSRYEYVRFADGFHHAATRDGGSGPELALRRVWTGGALRNATVDLRALPLPAGRAVLADEPVESAAEADEWAHTADEAANADDERDARLVAVGEAQYRVVRTPARAPLRDEPVRWLGKGLLVGTGFALVWGGGGRRVGPPN